MIFKIKKNNKKSNKNILISVNLHAKCNFKNTIISLTKINGDLLRQWSTKSLKKTKFKKNTPYNVQLITYKLNNYLKIKKIKKINIFFNGIGLGRRNILKNLKIKKIKIKHIFDKTSIPFNGCRKKKVKRR
jgi:small subunit ribosomal protein S11